MIVGGKPYFAKLHDGVGWAEVVKNLAVGKVPVLGARNEFEACRRLRGCGVAAPGVAAFAERGRNPARRRSLVVCDAVEGCRSLEELAGSADVSLALRRRLIAGAGALLRTVHAAGVYHRDCYAGHLLFDPASAETESVELAIIDLHRARVRERLPQRWRQRDLAALLFSATAWQLTPRELVRFAASYRATVATRASARVGGATFGFGAACCAEPRSSASAPRAAGVRPPTIPKPLAANRCRAWRISTPCAANRRPLSASTLCFAGGPARVRCEAVLRWRPGAQFAAVALVNGQKRLLAVFFGRGGGRRFRRAGKLAKRLAATGAGPDLLETGRSGRLRVLMQGAGGRPRSATGRC